LACGKVCNPRLHISNSSGFKNDDFLLVGVLRIALVGYPFNLIMALQDVCVISNFFKRWKLNKKIYIYIIH
jgi:hypothetical protein